MRSDLGFALIAVNFRKYTACEALHGRKAAPKSSKKVPITSLWWLEPFFYSFQLVMSQPLSILIIVSIPFIAKYDLGWATLLGVIAPFIYPIRIGGMMLTMLGGKKKETCCSKKERDTVPEEWTIFWIPIVYPKSTCMAWWFSSVLHTALECRISRLERVRKDEDRLWAQSTTRNNLDPHCDDQCFQQR